jgi:hypothetical protein
MIRRGLVRQGIEVVSAIRERYDGERRNPWNEFECGSNYARSLASYALLNAFSGFSFDMVRQVVGFDPVRSKEGKFRCFWSLDSGWGVFELRPAGAKVEVLYGTLDVEELHLPVPRGGRVTSAKAGEEKVAVICERGRLTFSTAVRIAPGSPLEVRWRRSSAK